MCIDTQKITELQDRLKGEFRFTLISLYNYNHLGVRALHSFLKSKGIHVELIFFKNMLYNDAKRPSEEEINKVVKLVKEIDPHLVGISVSCSTFYNIAKDITHNIKQEINAPVIWGGVHPTIDPDQCINHAEMVFIGEAEFGLLDLVTRMAQSQDYYDIPGLWVKEENGRVIKNAPVPLKNVLDLIPPNDYGDDKKYSIDNNLRQSGDPYLKDNETYFILTGRGCPFDCTYCINHLFKDIYTRRGYPIRRRSVSHVIDELCIAKKNFPKLSRIVIFDDVFVLDKKWAKDFCAEYKEKIGLPFTCLFHPSTIKEDIVAILKDGGLDYIDMGIESGSERIRRDIFGRKDSNETIRKAVGVMHKHNIRPVFDFILDNPFETVEDKRQTLDLLLSFPRPFLFYFYSLIFFPKTKLTRRAMEGKIITEEDVEDKKGKVFDQFQVTFSYKRNKEELFWICLFSLTGKSFIPRFLIRRLSKVRMLSSNPALLVLLATASNYIRVIGIGLERLFSGQLTYSMFKRYFKMAFTLNK
jgi:radical SAM superfamily enzyme YgiQ (UPF0313 family)